MKNHISQVSLTAKIFDSAGAAARFLLVAGTFFISAPRASAAEPLTRVGPLTRVDAIYTVPTVRAELALAAQFPARSDQNFYGSPQRLGLLRFSLPEELTGVETAFEIVRTGDGTWRGQGSDGSSVLGQCAPESPDWFACTVQFQNLKFDVVKRDDILGQRFGRGFEFSQREEVARFFEGQPVGVIKIRTTCDAGTSLHY